MPWDINDINRVFMQQALTSPAASFDQGRLQAKEERLFDEDRAAKIAAIAEAEAKTQALLQQKEAARQALLANPTPKAYASYYLRYPEDKDSIKSSFEALSGDAQKSELRHISTVRGFLQGGNSSAAKAAIQEKIDADKAAGLDTSDDEAMLSQVDDDPESVMHMATGILAAVADPEKFGDTFGKLSENRRAEEAQPYAVQEAAAKASLATTEAQYKPKVIESDLATANAQRDRMAAQTANEIAARQVEWARLNLDKDKLATETQLKLTELEQKNGTLDAGAAKVVNDAVMSAQTNMALADRASNLAAKFKATPMSGGWMASARTAWKGAWGSQDEVSGLRQSFEALVNSQAVKNLPPGPASDKDIQLAKQGFPPPNASKDYIVSFLNGMAKMQTLAAQADDRRANWVAANKSLAPARADMDIAGVKVPAGTTFSEFNRYAVRASGKGEAPPRDYITKYGGR